MNDASGKTHLERLQTIRQEIAKLRKKIDGLRQHVESLERQAAIVHDDVADIQARIDDKKSGE